ncbi:GDP dissociation inhibitor-domain-containing protein [Phycomyces nitens]|nr:GDP dissociation inhibitor-domain-containing protein [Phycomyces nitens]
MSNDNLQLEETHFDVIVLGTGLVESIAAGSLARAGQKVLHLDSNPFYGSNWSVFGFRELLEWCEMAQIKNETPIPSQTNSLVNGDTLEIEYKKSCRENFRNVDFQLYGSSTENPVLLDQKVEITQESLEAALEDQLKDILQKLSAKDQQVVKNFIKKEAKILGDKQHPIDLSQSIAKLRVLENALRVSRSYNLDMAPKLLSCQGELVETLIHSGVGRYLEFKSADDIFVFDETTKGLEKVPSSKEDVFTNKAISLIDKRKLMKFLTYAVHYEDDETLLQESKEMPYVQFLEKNFKITGKLQTAIVYAIALSDVKTLAKDGLERTKCFMTSIGRFGRGGYLCPLYGGGSEIAQAFCRVCAVYGGIYILNHMVEKYCLEKTTGECTAVVTADGQTFYCKTMVAGIDYLSPKWLPSPASLETWTARAILVTKTPLNTQSMDPTNAGLGYSLFPTNSEAGNTFAPIFMLHQNQETMTCPSDQYVTYLWTDCGSQPTDINVLQKAVGLLLAKTSEAAELPLEPLFAVYYHQRVRSVNTEGWTLPTNVIGCSTPNNSLDFEDAASEAKAIFRRCTPQGTEFLPPNEQDVEAED